ncbi:MAG: YlxM family DNA-binding protein [Bacillota bacterium]
MVRTGLLYDFYGGLLTDKQRQAMELYYLENWSLAEIADAGGVSKQAVHDLIQRSERIIEELESKLGLLQRFMDQQSALRRISKQLQQVAAAFPENSPQLKTLIEINRAILRLAEAEME